MRLELFDYPLPPERIAQTPLEPRDASRLLVLRADGRREHRQFLDLLEFIRPGDLLVFNDTRVRPARLYGWKETGARVEILLLQRLADGRWEALAYPGRRLQPGTRVFFGPEPGSGAPPLLTAEIVGIGEEGTRFLRFLSPDGGGELDPEAENAAIHRLGEMPLPPYIHERLDDPDRYQTVYAREEGSAAAPTAGLHFTPRVFQALQERGAEFAYVTLHVGIGTFRPVKVENVEEHQMHAEWYSVPEATARAVAECRGRVIAVGTTTVRCLESAALALGDNAAPRQIRAGSGETRHYIRPGYRFRAVEALVTNFHMPKSSLLIMVSAFVGRERILAAYQEALDRGYRFLSFGDAMFLERADL